MKNLYIDTNVYLTFYHLTNEDLEQLNKLLVLIENNSDICLHLPEQTLDEFGRNREKKIAEAISILEQQKLNDQFPIICKQYDEFKEINEARISFDRNKKSLLKKLMNDAIERKLSADVVINDLFNNAIFHNHNETLIKLAKDRIDLGKPPGKNKSYGDAINWETLLEFIPDYEDLYFISDDGDFESKINKSIFNSYLMDEWTTRKRSKIYYYRKISDFFKDQYPTIKLASEFEKDILIEKLAHARSYASSRTILYKLDKYEDFSSKQINDFVSACCSNNQVYWIKHDIDIKSIIQKIVNYNFEKISPDLLKSYFDTFQYPLPIKIHIDFNDSITTVSF